MADDNFPSSLSDRDQEIYAKLREEYGVYAAMGATEGDGTCSQCETYEQHGIHWDSCGNRGKIHMGWCSIEAWQAFRKGWFEEFGEMADFKQEARQKVAEAIKKGALFRVEIVEGNPNEKKPKVRRADEFTMTKPAVRTNPDYDLPFAMPVIDPSKWAVGEEKVVPTTLKVDGLRKPYKEGNDIEHPAHYNMFPVEAIDVCEHLGFNLGNVVKYTMRADFKGDRIKDLKKALFYLQREIDRDQPVPDTLDDWWRAADQSALLQSIHTWLIDRDFLDQKTNGCSINVYKPWTVKIGAPGRADKVINFSEAEKAEIIAAVEAKPE